MATSITLFLRNINQFILLIWYIAMLKKIDLEIVDRWTQFMLDQVLHIHPLQNKAKIFHGAV
jgi:hypothetical protein